MLCCQDTLEALLREAVETGQVAGCSLLIRKDGQEIAYAQAGYADQESRRPYDRDTIFRLYSMTKPVTAAAAMLLVQRGQLDLGAWVADYIPAFRECKVYSEDGPVTPKRAVLVRDLLNMTSGLSYGSEDPAGRRVWELWQEADKRLYTDRQMTTRELAEGFARCGLSFHPGEAWMYGTSADVLGAVVEAASGMPFSRFLQKEFFEPLGMKDTGFYVPSEKRHRLAKAYEWSPDGLIHYPTNHLGIRYTQDAPPAFESGGAGLVSTLDDYARFAQMLLNGGSLDGKTILTPASVAQLTGGSLTSWQKETMHRSWDSLYGYNYGNLMRRLETPGAANLLGWQGEYGWDGWLGAYFVNSPENGVTVLFSTQKRDAGTLPVTRRIRNVLTVNL